jgi:RNA polymerase sigma-70 factor, ECF subfamily
MTAIIFDIFLLLKEGLEETSGKKTEGLGGSGCSVRVVGGKPDREDRSKEDGDLVRRTLAGNNTAFMELVNVYTRLWYATAMSYVHHPEKAEDIVQEGVLKIFRSLDTLHQPEKFGSWAYTIVRRTALRSIEQSKLEQDSLTRFSLEEKIHHTTTDNAVLAGLSIEKQAKNEAILTAIYHLPKKYREVAVLFFVKGCSLKGVSGILGISVKSAEMNLYRAKRMLREALKDIR